MDNVMTDILSLLLCRYSSAVVHSARSLEQLLLAYGPQPSFDDMAWYGLAYARIYEVTRRRQFLSLAHQIFDWVWREGWDAEVCGGGVWFDQVSTVRLW